MPVVARHVFDDPLRLADGAADWLQTRLDGAVRTRGAASLVLAGGATPASTYRRLARRPVRWSAVDLYWGDERCVPPDHPASNYAMAARTLLSAADVPEERVHRIRGELPAVEAARDYERRLRGVWPGGLPRFDVVLLGVGEDGHVASLFPGAAALDADAWVLPVPAPVDGPDRVSLGPGPLAAARAVVLLVSGAAKAPIVSRLVSGTEADLPAGRLLASAAPVIWLLDRAAVGVG